MAGQKPPGERERGCSCLPRPPREGTRSQAARALLKTSPYHTFHQLPPCPCSRLALGRTGPSKEWPGGKGRGHWPGLASGTPGHPTQVVLPLGVALTPHLQSDWGVPLPSSRRASAFPGSGIFPPSPDSSPALPVGVALLLRGQGKRRGSPRCSRPPWAQANWLHTQPGGVSPSLECGLAACLHGRSVCWGMAWEGGSCSQRPPIFSPVYFNKINLTKERDSW